MAIRRLVGTGVGYQIFDIAHISIKGYTRKRKDLCFSPDVSLLRATIYSLTQFVLKKCQWGVLIQAGGRPSHPKNSNQCESRLAGGREMPNMAVANP